MVLSEYVYRAEAISGNHSTGMRKLGMCGWKPRYLEGSKPLQPAVVPRVRTRYSEMGTQQRRGVTLRDGERTFRVTTGNTLIHSCLPWPQAGMEFLSVILVDFLTPRASSSAVQYSAFRLKFSTHFLPSRGLKGGLTAVLHSHTLDVRNFRTYHGQIPTFSRIWRSVSLHKSSHGARLDSTGGGGGPETDRIPTPSVFCARSTRSHLSWECPAPTRSGESNP